MPSVSPRRPTFQTGLFHPSGYRFFSVWCQNHPDFQSLLFEAATGVLTFHFPTSSDPDFAGPAIKWPLCACKADPEMAIKQKPHSDSQMESSIIFLSVINAPLSWFKPVLFSGCFRVVFGLSSGCLRVWPILNSSCPCPAQSFKVV